MMLTSEKPNSSTKIINMTLLNSTTSFDHTKNWVGHLNAILKGVGEGNLNERILKSSMPMGLLG